MVERHIPGDSYRLLVIDQHVFSAVCRLPPIVVGDVPWLTRMAVFWRLMPSPELAYIYHLCVTSLGRLEKRSYRLYSKMIDPFAYR